jgi:diguanylate cyclase
MSDLSACRRWACLFLALLWAPLLGAAPLVLDDASRRIKAWPAVTMLPEANGPMSLAEVLAARDRFVPVPDRHASLGLRKEAVWLRVPVVVAADSDGRWVIDIDYAVLNRVEVHVLKGSQLLAHATLGNLQPVDQRPLGSRTPAMALELPPGERVEIFLRVQTQGALVLPIHVSKPGVFHEKALAEQLLQGLLAGLGVCLVIYSLMQAATLRQTLYLKYALLTASSVLFSVYQFGIGAQFVWRDLRWAELHAGGLSALVASASTFLFVEHALRGTPAQPLFSRAMKAGAALLLLTAAAHALDLLHLHQVSMVVGTIGLAPAVLGLPGAVRRLRQGDAIGGYFLFAWLGYFIATALMVSLLKGYVQVNFWTLHSFQIGATLDMLLFMRVIGLRMKAMHAAAQHARRERDTLHSLAHTDALTGLPNRRGLHAALAAELPLCRPERLLAVYMIDLDGFKEVNDRYGHQAGDELLTAVARRLKTSMRTSDLVARLGGDEFVVTVSGLHDDSQAQEIGQHLLRAFDAPFQLSDGRHCSVGLTIGYALVPVDGTDPFTLLQRADAAMYAGKQGGKRCLRRARLQVA